MIDEKGNVLAVNVVRTRGNWGFDRAVVQALKKWKFEPAKLENMPVRVWATQEIQFSL